MTLDLPELPAISPTAAALINRLLASGQLFLQAASTNGSGSQLNVCFGPLPAETGPSVELEFSGSFGTAFLCVENGLVDYLSEELLPGWRAEAPDVLSVEWRAVLVLEAMASSTLLKEVLTVKTRPGIVHRHETGPLLARLCGTVRLAEHSFGLSLDLSRVHDARGFSALSIQSHGRPHDFDPGFCCRLLLPGPHIAFASYRRLETGDVLLAGTLAQRRLFVSLEIPQIARLRAKMDLSTGSLEIFERAGSSKTMGDFEDDAEQPALETDAIYDGIPLDNPVDNLLVRLDFLLSTRRISLSELRALGPGATLDLKFDLTAPVTILANGSPAAKGHLVQIGNHIGIQISHWPNMKQNADD